MGSLLKKFAYSLIGIFIFSLTLCYSSYAGTYINTSNKWGDIALIEMVKCNYVSSVRALLEKKKPDNRKNKDGKTAYDFAETEEMKKLLKDHGYGH